MRLAILLLLGGCSPYVGYTHLSQPNIDDDGYDLICGGFEKDVGRFRGDLALCENMASRGGTYARVDGRIFLGKK